jgi:hypothetical protein
MNARLIVKAESVLGHIKGNRSFRRFLLRGFDKVHIEFGIDGLNHNIRKVGMHPLSTFPGSINGEKGDGEKMECFSPSSLLL